uniref:Uncharacterized protein n=1 Tax=Microviridae sp. ctNWS1 TaxID=2826733 RepID=A0A8S5N493_9VIRU|nr:MAG TPA: hypothetical protein [Microviridae sp. ctNWS1]
MLTHNVSSSYTLQEFNIMVILHQTLRQGG